MFKSAFLAHCQRAFALVALAVAVAAAAQDPREPALPAEGRDAVTLDAALIKTGLYLISGGGGNSLLRFSADGLILVDGKLPGSYRALKSQVRRIARISDLPVRVLVVTDHHATHAGNAAEFMASGVVIVAQENARPRLQEHVHPDGKPSRIVTYERDYTLRLGGVEAHVMHPGRAKTDDGAVVHFRDLRVVAVGDLFTRDAPQPDFAAGGSLVEWGSALAAVLKLDFDLVVPGAGPLATRADLQAFKTKIDMLVSRASELVDRGVDKEQLMAQLRTDDLGWRLSFTAEQLDGLYADLSQRR